MRQFRSSVAVAGIFALLLLPVKPTLCQGSIRLLGQVEIPGNFATDVWGYVDTATGKEYALVGDASGGGLVIVDVTNPSLPVQVSAVSSVPGFDVKGWQHYAYTVTGGSGTGGIVDISDPEDPQIVGTFPSSHNIFIAENGYMYSESPGLRILDLNDDPTDPVLVWSDGTSGGHDATVVGDRLYDFHGSGGTNIYDVSDPSTPQFLGAIDDPAIAYHHSGWPSEDGNYLFICDELASHPSADITVWNISNPGNAQKVGEFGDSDATVHNLFVVGEFAYVSYYTAGLRILDISDPADPVMIDEYDTSPHSGEGFAGAFGVYPFAPSGKIYLSDEQRGLFIFIFPASLAFIHEPPGDTEDSDGPYPVSIVIDAASEQALVPGTVLAVSGLDADFSDTTYLEAGNQQGEYIGEIPGLGVAGELTYYFSAQDSAGEWSTEPYGAPESFYSLNVGPDAVPPVIHAVSQVDNQFGRTGSVEVASSVTDNIAVGDVFLLYSLSGNTDNPADSVRMEFDDTEWRGEIGWEDLPWHSRITYWVKAVDSTSQLNVTVSDSASFLILNWTYVGDWEDEDLSGWDIGDGWGFVGFGNYGKVINDSPEGTYKNDAENILSMTEPVVLSAYSSAYLSFWNLSLMEENRDFGFVEISTDGSEWEEVTSLTGVGVQRDELIDLSPYISDDEIWLRFRMTSDGENSYGGWFIDDVLFAVDTTLETASLVMSPVNLPGIFALEHSFPNPFNASTTIAFTIPNTARVSLTIHDLVGREVAKLVDREMEVGRHEIQWDAGGFPTGVYFIRLASKGRQVTRKLLLLK